MKNIITLTLVACFFSIYSFAQVGVGTTNPNTEVILDVNVDNLSAVTKKGMLIPTMTAAERDASLEDNLASTPVTNTNLKTGTIIFVSDAPSNVGDPGSYQYWNGVTWSTLFVVAGGAEGNGGAVKLNSGGGGSPVVPSFNAGNGNQIVSGNGGNYGAYQTLVYATGLNFSPAPTTQWPENLGTQSPTDDFFFRPDDGNAANGVENTFIENPIPGQVHVWRVTATYATGTNSTGVLECSISNPNPPSSFNTAQTYQLAGAVSGTITFLFYTIADDFSIPGDINPNGVSGTAPDAEGYQIRFRSNKDILNLTVNDVTRISLVSD